MLQSAVVGQDQQSFRVLVESPGRVDIGNRDVGREIGHAVLAGELAEHTVGLVEQNQGGHRGYSSPWCVLDDEADRRWISSTSSRVR